MIFSLSRLVGFRVRLEIDGLHTWLDKMAREDQQVWYIFSYDHNRSFSCLLGGSFNDQQVCIAFAVKYSVPLCFKKAAKHGDKYLLFFLICKKIFFLGCQRFQQHLLTDADVPCPLLMQYRNRQKQWLRVCSFFVWNRHTLSKGHQTLSPSAKVGNKVRSLHLEQTACCHQPREQAC